MEVPGDQGLAHPQPASDLGDGQLTPSQLFQNPQARCIAQGAIVAAQLLQSSNVHMVCGSTLVEPLRVRERVSHPDLFVRPLCADNQIHKYSLIYYTESLSCQAIRQFKISKSCGFSGQKRLRRSARRRHSPFPERAWRLLAGQLTQKSPEIAVVLILNCLSSHSRMSGFRQFKISKSCGFSGQKRLRRSARRRHSPFPERAWRLLAGQLTQKSPEIAVVLILNCLTRVGERGVGCVIIHPIGS